MNILGNHSGKLNEIVFENRNKNYGAYVIRSSYNDSLIKSVLCVSGIALLLFTSVIIYNKWNAVSELEKGPIVDDLKKDLVYEVNIEQPKPKKETPQQQESLAAAPTGGMPTKIIDNATPTTTLNLDNPINGQGPDTAKGTSPTSTLVTTTPVVETTTTAIEPINSAPVIIAEVMPEFEGGMAGLMRYISQNISYPEVAKTIGKEGKVHVSFVVNEFGDVENTKVMRGIGYGCDEEVLRVISKMPRWKKVGRNGGHAVKVRFNIPVSFKLK